MRYTLLICSLFLFLTSCGSKKITKDEVFGTASGKKKYFESYDKSLKLFNTPYEEIDVATTYGVAHVIVTGPTSGKQLILFSGTDASSTMWFPNIKALSQEYRCYAIDFPAEAGKTHMYRTNLSNKTITAFYKEIFSYFKMTDISLVAVSRGAWTATYMAVQPDSNVKKLILLSPAQTFGGVNSLYKVMSALLLKAFPTERTAAKFFRNFSNDPEKIDKAFKNQLYYAYKYGNSNPRLLKMKKFSNDELKTIKIPVLLLIGDNDVINGPKTLVKAKNLIPQTQGAVIESAGHFLSVDQPEIVNKMMLDFLKQ